MTNTNVLTNLADRCDVYFEDALISREQIVKNYADFLSSKLSGENRSVSIALHTGSICFDIVSFIAAALGCIHLDETSADEIIATLTEGAKILYKNERYRWLGFEVVDGKRYMKLHQDGRGRNGPSVRYVLYETGKGKVRPYLGNAKTTDGRGIKKSKDGRADFISYIFGIPISEVPSVTGVSAVIITDKESSERITKGVEFKYGDGKTIGLLDVAAASYFTENEEEYRYGNNPAKTEPTLKIVGKVSTARNLVLDKRNNPTVGLVVVGASITKNDDSELTDILGRKSLKFTHIVTDIDFEGAEGIVEAQPDAAVFACTKEFLLSNSLPMAERNILTSELDRQIDNILNNSVTAISVSGGCSWLDMKKAKEALYEIKRSSLNEEIKRNFIISAYSLLNLLSTAVFPLRTLEDAVASGELSVGIVSPADRINELWNLAEASGNMQYTCAYVAEIIERVYKLMAEHCPKHDALLNRLKSDSQKRFAVVVPKAYYVDILLANEEIIQSRATIVTANRFDSNAGYEEIIAVGDITGKRFSSLKCRAAEDIVVLLYDCEYRMFNHKRKKAMAFEMKLNIRSRVAEEDINDGSVDIQDTTPEVDILDAYTENETDFEHYIDSISIFDIKKVVTGMFTSANTPTSEVLTVGRFTSGEQILFSRYYTAVIFDSSKGEIAETTPDKLVAGDVLIFAKRDDYTRNMVDYIYEGLLSGDRLTKDVAEATEKAFYWKEALREYRDVNQLTHRAIAAKLRELGSSIQEASIRHWLIEESHIVGPRDEKTLEFIATLTGDPYLLKDTSAYFEACRIVRRQRKEILRLIGKAITDKLSGNTPPKGSILESVYENIEKLAESFELESATVLDEPFFAPVNIVNKPLTEAEVAI